jgi:hypothetical protein
MVGKYSKALKKSAPQFFSQSNFSTLTWFSQIWSLVHVVLTQQIEKKIPAYIILPLSFGIRN